MLTCKEVAELVAGDAWRDPPLLRRLAVLAHLAMCRHCRAYVRQLRQMGDAARRVFARGVPETDLAARMTTLVREAAQDADSSEGPNPQ